MVVCDLMPGASAMTTGLSIRIPISAAAVLTDQIVGQATSYEIDVVFRPVFLRRASIVFSPIRIIAGAIERPILTGSVNPSIDYLPTFFHVLLPPIMEPPGHDGSECG